MQLHNQTYDDVDANNNNGQEQCREQPSPPVALNDQTVVGAGEHVAPGRTGVGNTEAQVGKAGLGQHAGTEIQDQVDQNDGHNVGQDVLKGDGTFLDAHCLCVTYSDSRATST